MGKEEFLENLRDIKIQGAKEIAIESLKFLKEYARENGFGKDFEKLAKTVEEVRPTAVVLHNCLDTVKREKKIEVINRLIKNLSEYTTRIAKNGSPLIKSGYVIMTHCHSGEALSVIKQAWKEGKKISVIATETSPKFQGVKTAKDLAAEGIPVTLITDSAVGIFMEDMDMVLVGSDAMREEGNVNKIGTYVMAVLAKHHKKPFYVAGNTLKLDKRKKFFIEERSRKEIEKEIEIYADLKGIKGINIRNPAYDITPWKFIDRVITEKGVLTPGNVLKLLRH